MHNGKTEKVDIKAIRKQFANTTKADLEAKFGDIGPATTLWHITVPPGCDLYVPVAILRGGSRHVSSVLGLAFAIQLAIVSVEALSA